MHQCAVSCFLGLVVCHMEMAVYVYHYFTL